MYTLDQIQVSVHLKSQNDSGSGLFYNQFNKREHKSKQNSCYLIMRQFTISTRSLGNKKKAMSYMFILKFSSSFLEMRYPDRHSDQVTHFNSKRQFQKAPACSRQCKKNMLGCFAHQCNKHVYACIIKHKPAYITILCNIKSN